jgi:hypothetical protein
MLVTVQLRDDVVRSEPQRLGTPIPLAAALADYSLAAQPLHPGTDDPNLSSFYVIDVPPHLSTDDLLKRLRALDVVEAAYVKPPDEMP